MDNKVIWAIRDARGLTANEKVFLFVVESRGEAFRSWDENAADMGLKKDAYYKARNSLLEKGVLIEQRRRNNTTLYTVNADGLHSVTQNAHSVTQNAHSVTQNSHSAMSETKKNIKKNLKENKKENVAPVADAPGAANSETQGLKDPSSSSEPDTKDGIVDLSEPCLSEPELPTCAGSLPAGPAGNYGAMNREQLLVAAEKIAVTCTDPRRRAVYSFGGNLEKIVQRAGSPEYHHLGTPAERVEAVVSAFMDRSPVAA